MSAPTRAPFTELETHHTQPLQNDDRRQNAGSGAGKAAKVSCCPQGRNLVVCIDGTANQFSNMNSNVVELYSLLVKDENQLTYYNSGIGTYVNDSSGWRSWFSPAAWNQWAAHSIDMAIAWNFKAKVLSAYQWLSENYTDGDRIFLFGFSRGAYQVRVIAGMLHLVGLLHKGNNEQIPFAYELYTKSISNDKRGLSDAQKQKPLCEHFKKTLSRPNVKAHFVGTWDTVSSVGFFKGRRLPETTTGMKHVCAFRQALALDELRVKFLPEFANGGAGPNGDHIKEVWFPGSHSDIGGGNVANAEVNRFGPALRWMTYEAIFWGLRMTPHQGEWAPIPLNHSMGWFWRVLEYTPLPIPRLSYKDQDDIERWTPHRARPRKILKGQLIHQSVLEEMARKQAKVYKPQPQAPFEDGWDIDRILPDSDMIERDPYTEAGDVLSRIYLLLRDTGERPSGADIHALRTPASSGVGCLSITSRPAALDMLISAVRAECEIKDPPRQESEDIVFKTLMQALSAFKASPQKAYARRMLENVDAFLVDHPPAESVRAPRIGLLRNVITELRRPGRLFALIIGIDDYVDPDIHNLRGAVADANAMAEYLENDLGTPSSQVVVLRNESATRVGIISAFLALANNPDVRMGDPIVVYFAGHGAKVLLPASWEAPHATVGEVVIPHDYMADDVPAIKDRTFSVLLARLYAAHGANITVIMDCSFSSAVDERSRGVRDHSRGSVRSPEVHISVGPNDVDSYLLHGRTVPAVEAFTFSSHIVIVMASGDNELAYEYAVPGGGFRGMFTVTLLKALRRAPGSNTYMDVLLLMELLPRQNPQLEGAGIHRNLFRLLDPVDPSSPGPLHIVRCEHGVCTMEAGTVHAIGGDDVFALYASSGAMHEQRPAAVMVPETISLYTTVLKADERHQSNRTPPAGTMVAVQTFPNKYSEGNSGEAEIPSGVRETLRWRQVEAENIR